MTDRTALNSWLDQADRVLNMVTRHDTAPDPICWGGNLVSCGTISYHPSGLCAAHRQEIIGASDNAIRC